MNDLAAILLAAGKGTRINAEKTNKILIPLAGKPMISYSLDVIRKLKLKTILVVVGFKSREVKTALGNELIYVNQKRLMGTGHAVKVSLASLPNNIQDVIVFYADHSSFYSVTMLKHLIRKHNLSDSVITFLTVVKKNPSDYGRILRDKQGKVIGIREEKNASKKEKQIKEINSGTYCFKVNFLKKYLLKVRKDPVKQEYLLTDLVELAIADNLKVETMKVRDEVVSLGINTMEELRYAEKLMKRRLKKCKS